jgi:hypothetical protein
MAISPPGTLSLCERENLCYRHPSNNISISDLPIGGVLRGRLPAPKAPASSGHLIVPVLEPQSPEAKMWHARGSVDRALFSSNPYIDSCRIRGKKMATIPMIPVGPVTTLNRSILLTERGISGDGGDDFICGHCGSVILEDFDPSTVKGNPVYQCGFCENNNDLPFAPSDGRHWSSR